MFVMAETTHPALGMQSRLKLTLQVRGGSSCASKNPPSRLPSALQIYTHARPQTCRRNPLPSHPKKKKRTKPTNKMPPSGKRPTARATDLIRPQRRVRDVLAVKQVVDERGAVGGKMLLSQIGHGAMSKGTPRRDRRRDGGAQEKAKHKAKAGEDGHFHRMSKSFSYLFFQQKNQSKKVTIPSNDFLHQNVFFIISTHFSGRGCCP